MDLTIQRTRTSPWLGYLDAMIALLLITLLTFIVAYLRDDERIGRLWVESRKQRVLAGLQSTFAAEFDNGTIRVLSDGNLQRLSFSDSLLFYEGSRLLREDGRQILSRLQAVLSKELESDPEVFQTIEIEAHADPRALRHQVEFRDNWQLSAARAAEVVSYFVGDEEAARAAKAAGRLTELDPSLFSASGFSMFRPPEGTLETLGNRYWEATSEATPPFDEDPALDHQYALARRMDVLLTYSTELPR